VTRIAICGAAGKMGLRIAALALKDKKIKIAAALERPGHPMIGRSLREIVDLPGADVVITSDPDNAAKLADCMIDFTFPEPTMEHLASCLKCKTAMVIGSTGLSLADEKKIKKASAKIPIVFSPNMAIGVNLVFELVAKAAGTLSPDFSIRIDETHHVHKKDSPSGTAKMIARVMKEASGVDAPIKAFREGEVVGNHGIIFESDFETIEIRHDAKSRDVFVAGALKAAKFLYGKKKGFFSMAQVLGLKKN